MDQVKKMTLPIAILNGDGEAGLSKKAASLLQKIGIDVAYTGNAKHYDYHYSSIVYPMNKNSAEMKQNALALQEMCGISNNLLKLDDSAVYVTLVLGHDKNTILNKLGALPHK